MEKKEENIAAIMDCSDVWSLGFSTVLEWLAFVYCLANSVEIHFYKFTAVGTDFFFSVVVK